MPWRDGRENEGSEEGPIDRGEYRSVLFQRFCQAALDAGNDSEVLEVGPSTPSNVIFWARRGHRVTALDLLSRCGKDGPEGRLEYADDRFSAVICWNVLTFLTQEGATVLMREIARVARDDAIAFAIFDGDGLKVPPAVRYRIVEPDRLAFEPLDRDPPRAVPTGEAERYLRSFRRARVNVMRHASREILAGC